MNSAHVEMPAIFQRLLMSNSSQFIIAHNHPSGNLTPSEEDIHLTRRIKRAGNLMGIKLLDHIIVNNETYTSFAEREIL